MAYDIKKTDGTTLVTIPNNTVVPAGSVGGVLDLTLYGKGKLDYGKSWNENFVHLCENFADSTEPDEPIEGQLWFDQTGNELKLRVGTSWSTLITSGAGASTFVNVTGDTMTGDLEFTIPSSGLPADSPGIVFTGNSDLAKIYVEEVTAEGSTLVVYVQDNIEDSISFRHETSGEPEPAEVLRMHRPSSNSYGIMFMTDDDGTQPMGTGANTGGGGQTMIFNEGGGNVSLGPDIRFNYSGMVTAGNHLVLAMEDGASTTIPGTTKIYFNKGGATFGAQTGLATIENDGTFGCAMDIAASGGTADWFLGGDSGTRIDFGSFNNSVRSLRASRRASIGGSYQARVRVEAADAVNTYDLTTKSQVESLISAGSVNRAVGGPFNFTTLGQLVVWNHNMGVEPYAMSVIMQCLVADQGYSVGNRIWMNVPVTWAPGGSGSNEDYAGYAVWHETVNQVRLRVAAGLGASSGITYTHKSTGAIVRLSNASRWAFYFRAMA